VSTSIGLFIGYTKTGPVDAPRRCFSFTDYVRTYGDDTSAGDMTRQVKLAFLNGLTDCYILRVADGAQSAAVTLMAEDGSTEVLRLEALHPGTAGDNVRAAITYSGNDPEGTFNIMLFRWAQQSNGTVVAQESEIWRGLSMDSASNNYAQTFLNSNSKLVSATVLGTPLTPGEATSTGGLAFANLSAWDTALTSGRNLSISVDGSPYVSVTLPLSTTGSPIDASVATNFDELALDITQTISAAFAAQTLSLPGMFSTSFEAFNSQVLLQFTSSLVTGGSVRVRTAAGNDAAAHLRIGAEQGGLEIGAYGALRPAATGVTLSPHDLTHMAALAAAPSTDVSLNKFDAAGAPALVGPDTITFSGTTLAEKLVELRDGINAIASSAAIAPGEAFPWRAELWGWRLAIVPTDGPVTAGSDDNRASAWAITTAADASFANIRYYSLGTSGGGDFQTNSAAGSNGSATTLASSHYDAAYEIVRKQVDLFNLLVLPRAAENRGLVDDLWANASIFAQERRALLLMEPPEDWQGVETPSNDITALRVGLSKQYAALYYPALEIREDKLTVPISPVGAVAGIMARTDNAIGVWKAPAGTAADVRGIVGVKERLSDRENGAINPKGINAIRALPDGVVVWGSRTMDGYDEAGSEYKYVPIRRVANYIEESLYRGLRWVVFEPNDEPLWAQIRLNVGAFMHDLFRKGAFQGTKPADAYFVKCDPETTTPTDRNLGIVNIWVGFAPLKPAEFVVVSLQQMAGQSEI
jgi:hypothetical protein